MEETEGSRGVQSVATACDIINALQAEGGATVSELGDLLERSPSSVHAHLTTLKRYGFVVQRDDQYRLGPYFIPLGEYVRNHMQLYQAAKEVVDELAATTGEGAHLIVEHDGLLLSVYETFGSDAVGREYHARKREEAKRHLHCTAAGKAILADYPEERVREIAERRGLPAQTERTITDVDELLGELAEVAERGYAVADREQLQGIRGVGAPIENRNHRAVGSISLSAPASRLKDDVFREEVPEQVMHAANIAEINLQGGLDGD